MSFLKKALGTATGMATGGLYSSSGGGLLQGGGVSGMLKNGVFAGANLASDLAKDSNKSEDPNSGMDIYNNQLMSDAKRDSQAKQGKYYGNTLDTIGKDVEDYTSRLKGNLDKNVARADIYNQQAGQQRALDNARAGLSGVDTSAMNEQGRRNAMFGAAGINEDAKRKANELYGQSIGNKIEGANTIENSTMANAIAAMKQPVTQQKPGLIGSIFGGFV